MVALHYPTHDLRPLRLPTRGRTPPAARAHGSGRPVPPRVYRRRRLTAAALFLGALLAGGEALGVLGGGPLTASEAGSPATPALVVRPVSRTTYVVAPGDTLWSIARKAQPTGDIRPLVDAMVAARRGRPLEVGERVEVGERIEVPRAEATGARQLRR